MNSTAADSSRSAHAGPAPAALPWRRAFVAGVAATYLLIFAAAALFGWTPTWSALGTRPMSLQFGDIRAFTGANISLACGLDPLVENHGDPWGRPANAPRIWLTFVHALHLRPEDTMVVGVALFAAFLGAMALTSRLIEAPSDAVLMYVCAVLPASLISIERGKIDSIVFLVVCGSIVAVGKPSVRIAALIFAAVLKLFPIFGVPAAMHGRISASAGVAFARALAMAAGAAVPFLNSARQSPSPRVAIFGTAALVCLAVSMIETPLTSTLHRAGTMVNIGAKVLLLAATACGLSLWLWDRWSIGAEAR